MPFKVITTGHVIEVYHYEKSPPIPEHHKDKQEDYGMTEYLLTGDDTKIKDKLSVWFKEMKKEKQVNQNAQRQRNNIRRLATSNFNNNSKFITLTFADNIKDVPEANRLYENAMKRIKRKYGNFKYITVLEFQKRGAVHYHMMCDLPYIKAALLQELWGNGYIKINKIKHVDNVGAYIVKYMTKDLKDERLKGKRAYFTSKNLERPIEYRGKEADEIIKLYNLNTKKEIYANSYESEYLGKITYKEYNLQRLETEALHLYESLIDHKA